MMLVEVTCCLNDRTERRSVDDDVVSVVEGRSGRQQHLCVCVTLKDRKVGCCDPLTNVLTLSYQSVSHR